MHRHCCVVPCFSAEEPVSGADRKGTGRNGYTDFKILISKSKEAYSTSRVYVTSSGRGGVAAAPAERGIGYYFTFEFEDGTQKTLRGDSVLYNVAVEGGSGTLDYKGTELISFTGSTEGTKPSQEKNSYEFVGVNNESWFSSKRH